jgi:hypothetical protein
LLDEFNNSVSFIKNPVQLTLNLTKMYNFEVNNVAVNESAQGSLGQGSVAFDSLVSACICDGPTFSCINPVPVLGPFSVLSVCLFSLNVTAQIDKITSYTVTQNGTSASLDSILNGAISPMTSITQSTDKRTACIQTQLYSNFFENVTESNREQRKLRAQGSVQLRLSSGIRRLEILSEPVIFSSVRSLKHRNSAQDIVNSKESAFKVDEISLMEKSGKKTFGNVGMIIGLAVMVLVAILVLLVVVLKEKPNHKPKHLKTQRL